jgi:hypothetical protein
MYRRSSFCVLSNYGFSLSLSLFFFYFLSRQLWNLASNRAVKQRARARLDWTAAPSTSDQVLAGREPSSSLTSLGINLSVVWWSWNKIYVAKKRQLQQPSREERCSVHCLVLLVTSDKSDFLGSEFFWRGSSSLKALIHLGYHKPGQKRRKEVGVHFDTTKHGHTWHTRQLQMIFFYSFCFDQYELSNTSWKFWGCTWSQSNIPLSSLLGHWYRRMVPFPCLLILWKFWTTFSLLSSGVHHLLEFNALK